MPDQTTRHRPRRRLDEHWFRSIVFTVVLVGLVAFASGADWTVTVVLAIISVVGFGFFHFLFPGGSHFGMTVANFLTLYACLFEFFRTANFPQAPERVVLACLVMPVIGFLGACFVRRRRVYTLIHARRVKELDHLPRLTRWLIGALAVGAATFALPGVALDSTQQGVALALSMATITAFVTFAVRDVVLVMVDVAMVFEAVSARLDRLVMPMIAFLTFYALLVVVFGCLYRVADLTTPVPQFVVHGMPARIGFIDALYYSVASITTLGFGDIAPASNLVRALTGAEVVFGVLMLLFGFSEIMRTTRAPED